MEFFNPNKLHFDFTKHFKTFGILSVILTILGFVAIAKPGINFGVDFQGGIEAQVAFNTETTTEEVRKLLDGKLENVSVVAFNDGTEAREFSITAKGDEKENISLLLTETLTAAFGPSGDATWRVSKMDVVGPKVGASLKRSALLSLIFTCILITLYMYWRFDMRFSPGALLCIFHDLVVVTGIIAVTGLEFSTTTVAALLTLAGYSINDTVVVYDRIRELEAKYLGKSKVEVVNFALNSTMSRTLMTSVTTLMSCAVLYFVGGPAIRDFALVLFIGIVIGTYSSIFVASPLYLWAHKRFNIGEDADGPASGQVAKART